MAGWSKNRNSCERCGRLHDVIREPGPPKFIRYHDPVLHNAQTGPAIDVQLAGRKNAKATMV